MLKCIKTQRPHMPWDGGSIDLFSSLLIVICLRFLITRFGGQLRGHGYYLGSTQRNIHLLVLLTNDIILFACQFLGSLICWCPGGQCPPIYPSSSAYRLRPLVAKQKLHLCKLLGIASSPIGSPHFTEWKQCFTPSVSYTLHISFSQSQAMKCLTNFTS
jgi:hypothetical protein